MGGWVVVSCWLDDVRSDVGLAVCGRPLPPPPPLPLLPCAQVAQVHRSPGFLTSVLHGENDDGEPIREFEASHGTVSDLWHAHQRGEPTSLNPLGMVEALVGAMQYADALRPGAGGHRVAELALEIRRLLHQSMVAGCGSKDVCGPDGLTTEQFVDHIADLLAGKTKLYYCVKVLQIWCARACVCVCVCVCITQKRRENV